jgi:hypothetical protein
MADPLGLDLARAMEHEKAQRAQDKAAFERDAADGAHLKLPRPAHRISPA